MTQFRFTSAALKELTQATIFYEQRQNGLGTEFLDEVDATLNRILQFPTAWHQLSPRTRRCALIVFRSDFGNGLTPRSSELEGCVVDFHF